MRFISYKYQRIFFIVAILLILCLYLFHASNILKRYLRYEIFQSRVIVFNESLPMPIVSLILNSDRDAENNDSVVGMNYTASLRGHPLPGWAYKTYRNHDKENHWQDYIDVNVVNYDHYDDVKAKQSNEPIWPLRMHYATGERSSGFVITGYCRHFNLSRGINKL